MVIKCNLCEEDGKEFKVPYDKHGIALMRQHFLTEHHHFIPETDFEREINE